MIFLMNGWYHIPYILIQIFLRPDISVIRYFWDPICLRLDISETQYFWDLIFLRPDIFETRYFWAPKCLRPDISETRYFWCLIFLSILGYFSLFRTISEFLMDICGFLFSNIKLTLGAEVLSTFCSCFSFCICCSFSLGLFVYE